jgi:hypothetical protein
MLVDIDLEYDAHVTYMKHESGRSMVFDVWIPSLNIAFERQGKSIQYSLVNIIGIYYNIKENSTIKILD